MRLSRLFRLPLTIVAILAVAYIAFVLITRPKADRVWAKDHEIYAETAIADSTLTVKNLRDNEYSAGTGEILVRYKDETYDLTTLKDVWFVSAPFPDLPRASHTFLTFRFEDGRGLSVSVEARRELGELYSIWLGMARQFETYYVWGTERDLMSLRSVRRGEDIELYRLAVSAEEGRKLLAGIVQKSEETRLHPEFYNTITHNCTTAIVESLDTTIDRAPGFDWRLLTLTDSPEMMRDAGLVTSNALPEAFEAQATISDRVREYAKDDAFSDLIREGF